MKIKKFNENYDENLQDEENRFIKDDGWNEEEFQNIGLMDILDDAASMRYEIKTARRGSYGFTGDTLKDVLNDVIDLKNVLEEIITELSYECNVDLGTRFG